MQNPQVSRVEALICRLEHDYWNEHEQFKLLLEAICAAKEKLLNLKALFIGDWGEHQFRKSKIDVLGIRKLLEAYPNLEVLQVRGRFSEYSLECGGLRHKNLKTLIIETADLNNYNLTEIGIIDLPKLEYLEIWLGRQAGVENLGFILTHDSFPNLKYLGLKSGEQTDKIAQAIINAPVLKHLSVLDLSMGTLTDNGVEALLNCPEIEQLHTLDISYNAVSEGAIAYLSELSCNLIADNQAGDPYYGHRYSALYE